MAHVSYLKGVTSKIHGGITRNVKAATLILHKEVLRTLRGGGRTGHEYRVPGGNRKYTASAPGEPPAIVTGQYLSMWDFEFVQNGFQGRVGNTLKKALWLERGTKRMRPRPTLKPAEKKARSKMVDALRRPIRD